MYADTLVRIAALEQDLLGKEHSSSRKVSACIESVIPTDRTSTTVDIMTALEALGVSGASGRWTITCPGYAIADFAQLIKTYSASQTETRSSPATITSAEKVKRFGNPDMDKVSASYSERLNLSVRMHVRRYTRLTNAHSKTVQHHTAMTSLFVAWCCFYRKHETLGKATLAMAAGLAEKAWTIKELLLAAA